MLKTITREALKTFGVMCFIIGTVFVFWDIDLVANGRLTDAACWAIIFMIWGGMFYAYLRCPEDL